MDDTASIADSVDSLGESMIENSKFYFQGQKLLLTYKSQLCKEDLIDFIKEEAKLEPKFIRCAHEVGDTEYEHTHVLIDFGKRFSCKNPRRFDVPVEDTVIHPNWRPMKSATHWRNCVKYIAKQDEENADLLVEDPKTMSNVEKAQSLTASIWSCKTAAEALSLHASTPSAAPGVLAIFAAKPSEDFTTEVKDLRPWQAKLLRLIDTKPDRRSVHWFLDEQGGCGKSAIARYLSLSKDAYVSTTANTRDFPTVVANALNSDWKRRAFIFDLGRSYEERDIYNAIEMICNGTVTAQKYQSRTFHFDPPHCIVFANFLPNFKKLSEDRWKIHRIDKDTLDTPWGTPVDKPPQDPETGLLNINKQKPRAPPSFFAISSPVREDNVASDTDVDWDTYVDELIS